MKTNKPTSIAIYAVLIFMLLIEIFPILVVICSSFTPIDEIGKSFLFPKHWSIENIRVILFESKFLRYMANTIYIAVVISFGSMFINSLSAYAFARMRFPFRNTLFLILVATLIIPGEVLILPQFVMISDLKWIDTYWALIVPSLATSFGIFFMKQFFMGLPRDLEDAAFIDGCGWFKTYFTIMLPLVKAPLLTVTLLGFVGVWDSFLWPITVINTPDKHMIQVAVSLLSTEFFTNVGAQYANVLLSSLPLVILFLFLQKQYISGITAGSIKG